MNVQLELWQLITLLIAFFGFLGGAGKVLIGQIDKRLEDRFAAMEVARRAGAEHWQTVFAEHLEQEKSEAAMLRQMEREWMAFRADLPIQYVRREDYVRNQTIIEAKLDQLRLSIENQYLKGLKND